MELFYCTPWQYSYYGRIYGLDLPASSTITDMRGAAGGRQLAAAETIVLLYITPGSYSVPTLMLSIL